MEAASLAGSCIALGILTAGYRWLTGISTPTAVALSFLLVVVIVSAVSTRRVAVTTSLIAFVCFNFFFLPPVGTFAIAKAEDLVALFVLLAVSLVASDLSLQARRRGEEALRLAQQKNEADLARRSAEIKSMLLASLSHDMATPLTAVMVAASNLTASDMTPEQRSEQAEIVRTEIDRLNRWSRNVVDLASIETRSLNAEPEWVQPVELVEAATRQVAERLNGHTIEVTGTPDPGLVRLDPRLTSAALAHVIENAAAYSPAGSPISVNLEVTQGTLRVSVRDHGSGLPPEDYERVFDRFYRGAGAREQHFGAGMGLAITRGLLAAEGARVSAHNHPQGGAVFTVEVPVGWKPGPPADEAV